MNPTSETSTQSEPALNDASAEPATDATQQGGRFAKRCARRRGRPSRMKRIAVMTGLLTLVAATAMAWGAHRRHMTPEKIEKFSSWLVDDVLDDLEADKRQRVAVQAIRGELVKEGLALRKGHRQTARQALTLWAQPQVDTKAVHELVDERSAVMTAFAHKVADGFVRLHGILNPAQRESLADRAEKRMAARKK